MNHPDAKEQLSADCWALIGQASDKIMEAVSIVRRGNAPEVEAEVVCLLGQTIVGIDAALGILGSSRAEALGAARVMAVSLVAGYEESARAWQAFIEKCDASAAAPDVRADEAEDNG